ncbi:hypothetical protein BGY98DRAFT_717085 [Russula aff. rugulosa BPL654]|nr:hypothetical protein BGY98DRAFT_717085 [Russula aff. rugulosa BPL654]
MGGEISQSAKGGQGTQLNQNQQPKQSGSTSASRQFVAPQCHDLVRKRKAESVTDGVTGTDDAPKRHKSDTPFFFPIQLLLVPMILSSSKSRRPSLDYISRRSKKNRHTLLLCSRGAVDGRTRRRNDERSRPVYWVRGPVHRVAETTADDFATLLTVIEEPMWVPHPSVKLRSLTVPFALHLIDVLY